MQNLMKTTKKVATIIFPLLLFNYSFGKEKNLVSALLIWNHRPVLHSVPVDLRKTSVIDTFVMIISESEPELLT